MAYKSITDVLQRQRMWGDVPLTVPPAADLIEFRESLRAGFEGDELSEWLFAVVRSVVPADIGDEDLKAVMILEGWFTSDLVHTALETVGLDGLSKAWRETQAEAEAADAPLPKEDEEDDDPT